MGNGQEQIQLEKYRECLMHIHNDLGMLIQNAENLAYKLGVIKADQFHYKRYDYYNQFNKKDIWTIRKNILSSLKFIKAQLIAIKQETGKEYIFPPSIGKIKNDVKYLKELVEKKSPKDVIFYDAILFFLEKKKFIKISDSEKVYKICCNNKKSDATQYMWMNMSPPILNNIDSNVENNLIKYQSDENFMPDIIRDEIEQGDNEKLIVSNEINNKTREINKLLKECKNYDIIKKKISEFNEIYRSSLYIEEENIELYNKILNDMK